MKMILLILSFLVSTLCNAGLAYKNEYSVGLYNDFVFDSSKITHIILVGSAVDKDSDQFFQSGISRAYRYKEVFPNHQVLILSSPDVVSASNESIFREFNVNIIKTVKETFYPANFFSEIAPLTKIASLDFFGHSSPWGIKIGKSDAALNPFSYQEKLTAIKGKFLKNAYMTISSCNSGFTIAPEFSRLLEIPVAGSLSSSLFERIESDGHWYKEDDYTPRNFVEENHFSNNETLPCSLGVCVRMKPARFNYSAYWGNFDAGGLSFYKFFCNFDNNDHKCEVAMASSLLGFPSVKALKARPSLQDYKEVAIDWLCSSAKDKEYYQKCSTGILNAVNRGDLIYQSHPGNELICDFKGCNATVFCKNKKIFGSGPRGGSCKITAGKNEAPINAAREYNSLLLGFELLIKEIH